MNLDLTSGQWAAAQERYMQRIIQDHSRIRVLGQTGYKLLKDIFTDVYVLDEPTASRRFDREALRELLARGNSAGHH